MNNIKEEFRMLEEFKTSICYKVKKLEELKPTSELEQKVIDSQFFAYTTVLGEINDFIRGLADQERDKFSYITNDTCFE